MADVLITICSLLGCEYDSNYLSSLNDDCKKVNYLLNQIYKYLGG